MIYLANASSPSVRTAMRNGEIGMMCTPRESRAPLPGVTWAADNGCYGKGYPGDAGYVEWLLRHSGFTSSCLFATAPDVVGNALSTLSRSLPMLPKLRGAGYQAALVAQDGLETTPIPWREFDVLFIGGTTDWKLSAGVRSIVETAVRRGVPVHMGRVNSGKRYRYARDIGCASADGTFLAFGPDDNLLRLRRWTQP